MNVALLESEKPSETALFLGSAIAVDEDSPEACKDVRAEGMEEHVP